MRCFASLLYTYRRFLGAPSSDQKKSGLMYSFNIDGFMKSMPSENQEYFTMLRETQGKLRLEAWVIQIRLTVPLLRL